MPALTDYDKKCLAFINKQADMVGYSFVRNTKDILQLQEAMGKNKKLALIIKIETPEAVKNLPDLLFCGMREENIGVMICLLYTSPSPRDRTRSRMPSSAWKKKETKKIFLKKKDEDKTVQARKYIWKTRLSDICMNRQ